MNNVIVYISLGSNLNNPQLQLENALQSLKSLDGSKFLCCSKFHETAAIGPGIQPDYLNAAAKISTRLPPIELLKNLQAIENQQKRERTIHWGARTIDLDILLYGDHIINLPNLTIPHPRMKGRAFVMEPLLEIEPGLIVPT